MAPESSHDTIRVVSLSFLDIIRFGSESRYISRLGEGCVDGLKTLRSLPGLQEITFRIAGIIVTKDMKLLAQIHDSIGHRCKIIVAFMRYAMVGMNLRARMSSLRIFFTPKLSYEASETLKRWEWKISGHVGILESLEDESLAIAEALRQQNLIAEGLLETHCVR